MIAAKKSKKARVNNSENEIDFASRGVAANSFLPNEDEHAAAPKKQRRVAAKRTMNNDDAFADHASTNPDSGDFLCASHGVSPTAESVLHAASGGEPGLVNEMASASICRSIQELQRQRVSALKSRITIDNQLAATVATSLGYHAGMEEKERKAQRAKAVAIIKQVDEAIEAGDDSHLEGVISGVASLIALTKDSRDGFDTFVKGLEKEMVKLAKTLPIAAWVNGPELRGFGILSLAIIVGEAGDLANYPHHMHLWKRLGCAPFKGKMPSTWKRTKNGLTAEEWTVLGYSPRRRSISFLVGENIVKQNHSQYRQKYDEVKASKAGMEDWPLIRAHRHGMLLATKMLLKDLWRAWRATSG